MSDSSEYYFIRVKHLRLLVLILAVVVAVLAAISNVLADTPADVPASWNDGRLNVAHHFGGDVLYCVDKNMIATHDFFDNIEGGFQLLNLHGEQLWFVPATTILEKVAEAQPAGGNVLVAEGQGTYGPVAIYTYKMTDGTIRFIFTGVDEHGSPNQMDFERCLPVNPPASPGMCTIDELIGTLDNDSPHAFLSCYDRACGSIDLFENPSDGIECLCSKYPDLCEFG